MFFFFLFLDVLLKSKNFIKVSYYLTVNSNRPLGYETYEVFSRFLNLPRTVFSSEIKKYFPCRVVMRI